MTTNSQSGNSSTKPLQGLTVLELGHFIAAPHCTRLMADLGANIIKVEAPGNGDPIRQLGDDERRQYLVVVCTRTRKTVHFTELEVC